MPKKQTEQDTINKPARIVSEQGLAREVFETFSKIKFSEDNLERIKKGKDFIVYIKWATAILMLRKTFPLSGFYWTRFENNEGKLDEYCLLPDGTAYVQSNLWISKDGFKIDSTWDLPVYGYGHKVTNSWTANDLNTAKVRCLVKHLATHGLGIDIYGGKDETVSALEASMLDTAVDLQLFELNSEFSEQNGDLFDALCVRAWNKLDPKSKVKDVNDLMNKYGGRVNAFIAHLAKDKDLCQEAEVLGIVRSKK
tara:strand:+ start:37959 stop:38717 length:759 start_codon:yes stop_codon:yes gene_type:complete